MNPEETPTTPTNPVQTSQAEPTVDMKMLLERMRRQDELLEQQSRTLLTLIQSMRAPKNSSANTTTIAKVSENLTSTSCGQPVQNSSCLISPIHQRPENLEKSSEPIFSSTVRENRGENLISRAPLGFSRESSTFSNNLPAESSAVPLEHVNTSSRIPELSETSTVDLLKHVTTLLSSKSSVIITKPVFKGESLDNPNVFLEKFLAYARSLRTPPEDYLLLLSDSLAGNAANWASIYKTSWHSFEDFKNDFLQHYWSMAQQNELRRRLISSHFRSSGSYSMSDYFIMWISRAKFLTSPLPEEILVNDIMSHFSPEVRTYWAHSGGSTCKEALVFLRRHEAINLSSRKTFVSSNPDSDVPKN